MDLVSKRYSNPCFFMDGMIQTGRFEFFIDSFISTINREREEQTDWEFFLHKVWDESFSDFKEGIRNNKKNQEMPVQTIETTVKNSMSILKNFKPIPEEGGEHSGTV